MKIRYRNWEPKLATQERIVKINAILSEYKTAVSVRQLYYRLVSTNVIANDADEYRQVQDVVTKARYAGLIDWDAIEDRNREALKHQEWSSAKEMIEAGTASFRLDRWEDQHPYLELWCEKAALAGVLMPIANDYHITLMVNRGYSSASAMKESADRIIRRCQPSKNQEHGHRPTIIYIGDFDPSGEDMVRDIKARLLEFRVPSWLDVRKLALTPEQIEEHNPPPNPVKMKDVRAKDFVDKYGEHSWEVDALPPPVLDLITRRCITSYIDRDKMTAAITRENLIKAKLKEFSAQLKGVA